MAKTIRVGIIGTGNIYNSHARAYQALEGVEIFAVADLEQERAQAAAERYDVPHVFTDHNKLLEMEEINAVSVCTANMAHAQPSIDAMKAEKHVIVEKPMAARLDDAAEMVRTARRTGKILMVGHKPILSRQIKAARQVIEEGTLGEIYYGEAVTTRRRFIPGRTFIYQKTAGGGTVLDIGVYPLGTLMYLMDYPTPVAVSGAVNNFLGKSADTVDGRREWDREGMDVEDFGIGLIRFEGGACVMLKSSWAAHIDSMGQSFLLGKKGGMKLNPLCIYRDQFGMTVDIASADTLRDDENMFLVEIKAFIDAVREGGPSPIDSLGMLKVNMALDGIYRSAEAGGEVRLRLPDIE